MKLEINEFDETLDYTKPIYLRTMLGTIYTYNTEDDKIKLDSRIVKASNNKIDLVEVGDVICYINKRQDLHGLIVEQIRDERYLKNLKMFVEQKMIILKSIVTKEQFKSCEYKFEEE